MKPNIRTLLPLLLLLPLLPGCSPSKLIDPDTDTRTPARFVAQVPQLRVEESRWEAGDCIGISSAERSNAPYVTAHGDGRFSPKGAEELTLGETEETFSAYYPYRAGSGTDLSIDLAEQHPVLFGEGSGSRRDEEVELHFTHRLAQLRVRLVSEVDGLSVEEAMVQPDGYLLSGVMDRLTGEVRSSSASPRGSLSTKRHGDTFYSYILPGETLGDAAHRLIIDVGTKRIEMEEPVMKGATTFESGKYYLITIHLRFTGGAVPEGKGLTADIRAFVEGGSIEDEIILPGEEPGEPGTTPPGTGGVLIEEHFDSDLGVMTSHAVITKGVDFSVVDGAAQVSGYKMGLTKIFLLSPPIDLRGATSATLSFAHNITYPDDMERDQTLLVTTDYLNLRYPEAASWKEVPIPHYPDGFTMSLADNTIELPEYLLGQPNVHFAFCYRSRDGMEATWRIDDLTLRTTGGGAILPGQPVPHEPDLPEDPVEPLPDGLLFPGGDCEDEAAFLDALGEQGMRTYVTFDRDPNVPERGGVLSVEKDNGDSAIYLFSVKGGVPSGSRYITFLLKGRCAGSSLSVNVYGGSVNAEGKQNYYVYNLGVVRSSDLTLSPEKHNSYAGGSVDTGDRWIRVRLDLSTVTPNTSPSRELFAVKLGPNASADLMLDDFRVE